jgi:hypothetical protein
VAHSDPAPGESLPLRRQREELGFHGREKGGVGSERVVAAVTYATLRAPMASERCGDVTAGFRAGQVGISHTVQR